MRTTVILPDDLYGELRRVAAEDGRTMTSVLEDALRELLRDRAAWASRPAYEIRPLPGGRGLRPGVDLDDGAALADVMDAP